MTDIEPHTQKKKSNLPTHCKKKKKKKKKKIPAYLPTP